MPASRRCWICPRDEFDLVALGRAALSEPEWPTRLRKRRPNDPQLSQRRRARAR